MIKLLKDGREVVFLGYRREANLAIDLMATAGLIKPATKIITVISDLDHIRFIYAMTPGVIIRLHHSKKGDMPTIARLAQNRGWQCVTLDDVLSDSKVLEQSGVQSCHKDVQ